MGAQVQNDIEAPGSGRPREEEETVRRQVAQRNSSLVRKRVGRWEHGDETFLQHLFENELRVGNRRVQKSRVDPSAPQSLFLLRRVYLIADQLHFRVTAAEFLHDLGKTVEGRARLEAD